MNPIDELAQIIRTVDGNHDLGAAALAERLIEAGVMLPPRVIYAERAEYRDPEKEVTLVGRVFPDGVRIGCQALEPWYGTGVLIPPTHPAYMPAQRFLAALSATEAPA